MKIDGSKAAGIRHRVVIVTLLLIVPNAYFVVGAEILYSQGLPTRVALFYSVVFILFLVTLLNTVLERFLPKVALTRAELGFLYIMLSLGASLAGTDMLQSLMPMIGHPFWFATPENDWKTLYWQYIPKWLTVQDTNVLDGFYRGDSTPYTTERIQVWISRLAIWLSFIVTLLTTLLCINVILRKQWVQHEKLTYPIIQLPLEITRGHQFFKQKSLWWGFLIAGGIDTFNGLSYLYPAIPTLPVKAQEVGVLFTEKPWNAIGMTRISFYPFLIGISYLVPLDLCFSVWFFYLFYKVERILGSVIGLQGGFGAGAGYVGRFPFPTEQSFGAYVGLLIIAVWAGRKYFLEAIRKGLGKSSPLDDSAEPMAYRGALLGLTCGIICLLLFSHTTGMSLWVAITFFTIYFIVSTTIVRMRAELGPPEHSFAFTAPGVAMVSIFGSRKLGKSNLVMLAYYFWFTRSYRGHQAAHQLEGFKIADTTGMNARQLLLFMILFIALGTLVGMWVLLHASYKLGATSRFRGTYTGFGNYFFSMLDGWVKHPANTDFMAVGVMGFGLIFTFFLQAMRMRFFWWPFHGAGYALSGSFYMDWVWFPFLMGWTTKGLILRFGGFYMYRQLRPFFLGLILGEFIIGGVWNLIGFAIDYPLYTFWR